MRFLTKNEKVILVLLITGALIMVVVSIYLSMNNQNKENLVVNNRVHVIHASGEIEPQFQKNYAKFRDKMGQYDLNVYGSPINSFDIVPNDWNKIAKDIGGVYNNYDAFVVVCGKDTLAYTASALSFMMENLSKPVILTDGELFSALMLASSTKIPEVSVVSRGKLLRGCRAVPRSTEYFKSPNYPALTELNALKKPTEQLSVKFVSPKVKIIIIKIFPGMDEKFLLNLLKDTGVHGVVFELYGVGHSPTTEKFLTAINQMAKKGVIMVAVSQCDKITKPDVDIRLLEAGVLSGGDMTPAAAYTKLCFLLGNVEDKKLIGKLVEKSFRGEMTVNYTTIQ